MFSAHRIVREPRELNWTAGRPSAPANVSFPHCARLTDRRAQSVPLVAPASHSISTPLTRRRASPVQLVCHIQARFHPFPPFPLARIRQKLALVNFRLSRCPDRLNAGQAVPKPVPVVNAPPQRQPQTSTQGCLGCGDGTCGPTIPITYYTFQASRAFL